MSLMLPQLFLVHRASGMTATKILYFREVMLVMKMQSGAEWIGADWRGSERIGANRIGWEQIGAELIGEDQN